MITMRYAAHALSYLLLKDLREVFEKFGDVGDVFIPTDRESGRPRGFAFVRFIHKRDAEVSQAKVMVSKHRN